MAIDIGNTHTVVGIYEGQSLRGQWRFSSDHTRTPDECGLLLRQLLAPKRMPAVVLAILRGLDTRLCPTRQQPPMGCAGGR